MGTVTLQLTGSDANGPGTAARFTPTVDTLRAAARAVDHYIANYGGWSADSVAIAKQVQLVIAHPGQANISRAQVAELQAGVSAADPADDVLVLCYVSVGEDLRTGGLSDAQVRADPRFKGDGTGPRIDPRGPTADGTSLAGIDPKGLPSNGGTGFASYYLDDNDVHNTANHVGDGFPDRNKLFGGLFVNAGDPGWFDVVDGMTLDGAGPTRGPARGPDRQLRARARLRRRLPRHHRHGGAELVHEREQRQREQVRMDRARVRRLHPARSTAPIRTSWSCRTGGLFFFDPRQTPVRLQRARRDRLRSLRELPSEFEHAPSCGTSTTTPTTDTTSRPKLMAEANRPDGFRVLSLGYAAGPAGQMSTDDAARQIDCWAMTTCIEDIRWPRR